MQIVDYLKGRVYSSKLRLVDGEFMPIAGCSIKIDLSGFLLTIIKIGVLRSIDNLTSVLIQILTEDLPALRGKFLFDRQLLTQQTLIEPPSQTLPVTKLDQDFLISKILGDAKVLKVIRLQSVNLIQAFNFIAKDSRLRYS
jgi:hypothetical protein